MKIWTNFKCLGMNLEYEDEGTVEWWSSTDSKHLYVINNTTQSGYCIDNVNLGYVKKNHSHFIYLNVPKKRPSTKTVGIFASCSHYETIGGARFLGKNKKGMFGIYNVGTLVTTASGEEYLLTEDKGWILV